MSAKPEEHRRLVDLRDALIGGGVAALVMFVIVAFVGSVSPFKAIKLLEAVLPTIRFLASSVLAAVATVMALMLTLLSLTYSSNYDFREIHYRRIRQITTLSTVAILASVILLLILGMPVEEAEQLRLYYDIVYYTITALASLLGGLLIAIVLMLQRTIRGLIDIGHPDGDSPLIASEHHADDAEQSHAMGRT